MVKNTICMGLARFTSTQRPLENGKVVEIGMPTNRKPCAISYNFYCNYMPIFYRVRERMIYCSKICIFRHFCPLHSRLNLKPLQGGSCGTLVMKVGIKERVPGLRDDENLMKVIRPSFCRAMLCKFAELGLCCHAVFVCVCVCHVRHYLCQNE